MSVRHPCTGLRYEPAWDYRGTSVIRYCPPLDLTADLFLGPYGGPGGLGVFLWARYICMMMV